MQLESTAARLGTHRLESLLRVDDARLLEEVGLQTALIRRDPTTAGQLERPRLEGLAHEFPAFDMRNLGLRLFVRYERELHNLLCGENDEDSVDREELRQSLRRAMGRRSKPNGEHPGEEARELTAGHAGVASILASALVANFGLAGGIAMPLAALITKRVVRPALDETCRAWGDSLRSRVRNMGR
jgi:hypothetical protein